LDHIDEDIAFVVACHDSRVAGQEADEKK